jgi:transposase
MKRYTEEFKIEAVKQITERNHPLSEVAKRLGCTKNSLYNWIERFGDQKAQHREITD